MKRKKKTNKQIIILPIFCISLAVVIILVHVFSLPKKALGQVIGFVNQGNVNEITNEGEGAQERFNIAAYNNNPEYISLPDNQFEGMGAVDPYRGNGIDVSSYVNDQNNMMINADYQNLIQIAAPGEATTIFNKGVKVVGDVIAPNPLGLIFQGHQLRWSMPIKGNHIYYYR